VNERRTVVGGGLIGHCVSPPPTVERDRRACECTVVAVVMSGGLCDKRSDELGQSSRAVRRLDTVGVKLPALSAVPWHHWYQPLQQTKWQQSVAQWSLATHCIHCWPIILWPFMWLLSRAVQLRDDDGLGWWSAAFVGSGEEVAVFQQTAANFRQRILWVLKISILPLNVLRMDVFLPQILHFWTKILRQAEHF